MEMHSRQSLHEIHGLSNERRRPRSRLTARLLMRGIGAFLVKMKQAIEAELAIRRATTERADMDDRMLRDLGLRRSEIEGRLRRPLAYVRTDNASIFANIAARSQPDLPTVNSAPNVPEGGREQESHKQHSSW